MREELEAARIPPSVRRSATQEATGRKERPEGRGQAPCDCGLCGLEIRDVRAGCHARHARLVQMLQSSMYSDIEGPSEW